jgi:ABC-2 type transport system ATP-binding protein
MCNAAATVVDASGITKRFGELSALCDVGLAARPGDVHGLLGANGAGKTTLLRILLGLVRRDEGHIRLFDQDLPVQPSRVPDGVGAALEGTGFYPFLTGRRNLALLARLDDLSMADRDIDVALSRVGLAVGGDRPVAGYSAGMRQRLALASALLRAPRLLLLDEPTSALDPAGARDVRALIGELAAAGTAVVLSSHDLSDVERLCSSVTLLRAGRVVFSGGVERFRALAGPPVVEMQTSDDGRALQVGEALADLRIARGADADRGFEVAASPETLDRFVVALGRAGIAVRRLQPRERSLETVFLRLTAAEGTS